MEAATATRPAIAPDVVHLAAHGDEASFTRIVAAHHGDMVKVCFTICRDVALAEEAAQAAWSLAWRRLPSLRDPDRLRSWLVSIAANQARDALRRSKRRLVVELAMAAGVTTAPDPASRTGDIDLRNALVRLDPSDRALVALRYVAGLDSTELGRALGMSASGARARLARILERLRTELGDD